MVEIVGIKCFLGSSIGQCCHLMISNVHVTDHVVICGNNLRVYLEKTLTL